MWHILITDVRCISRQTSEIWAEEKAAFDQRMMCYSGSVGRRILSACPLTRAARPGRAEAAGGDGPALVLASRQSFSIPAEQTVHPSEMVCQHRFFCGRICIDSLNLEHLNVVDDSDRKASQNEFATISPIWIGTAFIRMSG
jgi:hypothetical protein